MTITRSFKDLFVWQRATELAVEIYLLTNQFPKEEQFGLISQMRRSAISIASNIAEGRHRGTRKDYIQFLHIAYSSGAELETQIFIARQLPKTQSCNFQKASDLLLETMKMLNSMLVKMKA